MIDTILIGILVFLVILSGVASSSETAFFSLSTLKIKSFKDSDQHRKYLVYEQLSRPKELLITILMVNVLVNISIQNVSSGIFDKYSSWALSVGVPVAIVIIFGELIPKTVGLLNNEKIACAVSPIIKAIQTVFLPIRVILSKITGVISPIIFFFLKKDPDISITELQHALDSSYALGVISSEESELVGGYLKLEEASVKEHMHPHDEIPSFDINRESLEDLFRIFKENNYPKILVCENGIENVLGLFMAHDLFTNIDKIQEPKDIIPFLSKPLFVPESMPAKSLLIIFYRKKESMALVVDEWGSISGVITLEDLIELILGEIYDKKNFFKHYTKASEDVIIASGKMELAEFEDVFSVELKSDQNVVTIGGWLTEKLGDIPPSGTKYESDGFIFQVLRSDPNRIKRVYIRKLKK